MGYTILCRQKKKKKKKKNKEGDVTEGESGTEADGKVGLFPVYRVIGWMLQLWYCYMYVLNPPFSPSLSVYKLLYCFYFGLVQCSLPWKQTKMLILFIISLYGQKKKKKKKKKEGEKTSGENQTEEAKVRKFSINMQENGGNFFLITYLVWCQLFVIYECIHKSLW